MVYEKPSVRFDVDGEHALCELCLSTVRNPSQNGEQQEQIETSVSFDYCRYGQDGSVDIVLQVINYKKIFEIGSPPLIHGKITTLPASRITKGLQCGLSKATRSWNGRHPDRVPFCGSMGNVC